MAASPNDGSPVNGASPAGSDERRAPARAPWAHRLVVIAVVLAAVGVLAAGGTYGYLRWRFAQFDRVAVGDDLDPIGGTGDGNGVVADGDGVKVLGGEKTQNILIVGTDSRANVDDSQAGTFGAGKVSGQRSDTIMVLRLDPKTHQAWILSIPRDLWVKIDGKDSNDRVNAAFAQSPGTLIRTIKSNLGIPINHYAEIDFVGFQSLVDAVDGVDITFKYPARDKVTGLNQPAGRNKLDARQAIAYVRSRHYEEFRNGVWISDRRGDLGRISRQQSFIRATLQRSIDKGGRNPVMMNSLLAVAVDAVKIDDNFKMTDITRLANEFREFDPNALNTYTVPAVNKRIGSKDVLEIVPDKAATVVGQFGRL